ncbi:uroporphyrinogen decarboxylase family protein [candidate division KSB1 bacterium]|nr:uroporphyrinogen decarboxylase family protein [candidate division KSB1 bacterium]
MTPKHRMQQAMALQAPDRVPVMCQLALGHYFLQAPVKPLETWYTSEGFAEALVALQRRYHFDGILVNLPGRDPNFENFINTIAPAEGESIIRWKNGNYTVFPNDDNPHYYLADGTRYFPAFQEIKPEELYYVEPWDLTDITYPYTWGFEAEPRPFDDYFPDYHFDTIKLVLAKVGDSVSVHSEVFSPWSQFLELLNYEHALMAILDDPGKAKACLERLADGAIDLAQKQAACGVDAVLISSAFAGAGLISRQHYEEFVLPYEQKVIAAIKKAFPALPVYTHTCGSIGDRLDLMMATGANGIDTLDPPPLGTVELEEAKKILSGKTFIKGNIDPVNTLLYGSQGEVKEDVKRRLEIGKPGGGYILSSACSVAPHTPPENIEVLAQLAETFGKY